MSSSVRGVLTLVLSQSWRRTSGCCLSYAGFTDDGQGELFAEVVASCAGFTDLVPLPRDQRRSVSTRARGSMPYNDIRPYTISCRHFHHPHPRRSSSKMRLHDRLHYWCLAVPHGRRTPPAVPAHVPLATAGGGDRPSVELPCNGVVAGRTLAACNLPHNRQDAGGKLQPPQALRATRMRATGAPAGAVPRASALNAKHYPPPSKRTRPPLPVEMRRLVCS